MPSSKALSNDEQKEASKVCKGERPLTAFCWLPLVGFCYPCRPLFVPLCVFFSKRLHCTAVHVWSCLGRRRHSSCCCCRCWLQKAVLPLTVSQGIQWYVSSIVQRLEMLDGYGDSGSSRWFLRCRIQQGIASFWYPIRSRIIYSATVTGSANGHRNKPMLNLCLNSGTSLSENSEQFLRITAKLSTTMAIRANK